MLGEREVLGGETHRFRVEGVSPPKETSSAILLNRWDWFKKLVLGTDFRGISLWFVLIFRRSGGQLRLIEWRNLL